MRVVDQIKGRIPLPPPNTVSSGFVMDCVAAESEGDGMLFAALWQDKLLYVIHSSQSASWYVWNGHCWQRDANRQTPGLVRFVVERYGEEIERLERQIVDAKTSGDKEAQKSLIERLEHQIDTLNNKIRSLRQPRGRNACLEFAVSYHDNPLSISSGEFDHNPWLLGVQNGVVDLRTGELTAGRPEQMVSRQCSCAYDPDVDTGEWQHFLQTIFNNDQELLDFIQQLFGYGATGLTTERIFPFLLGARGRNGKSQFFKTILRVMGDYAAVVSWKIYMKDSVPQSPDAPNPSIMKHEGLRMTFASEVEEGCRFSAQAVKMLTGGDPLEGREMYGSERRQFEATHLSIMIGNHEPIPPAGDEGFWARACLIHFPVHFVDEDPDPEKLEKLADPDIEEKLQRMDQQVLAWLIEGAVKWNQGGRRLRRPACVLKATDDYREDADWIGRFVEACCSRAPGMETGSSTLYTAFVLWYQETINSKKTATPSQRSWGQKFKALGEFKSIRRGGGYVYTGVVLNAIWERRMMDEALGNQ